MLRITSHPRRFRTTSKRLLWRHKSTEALSALNTSENWYTSDRTPLHGPGKMPGLMKDTNTLTSLPLPNLNTVTREQALDYLDNTWVLMEELFASLRDEETYVVAPYHGLRHPMMFYYGHPTVFYVNKLRLAGVLTEPVNEYYEEIFEVGVDEMSWDDMSKNEMVWPELSDVMVYRRAVYQVLKDVIETHPELDPGHAPITPKSALWSLFMGFEHDHIHLETSSVLIRELPLERVRKPTFWPSYYPFSHSPTTQPVAGVDYPAEEWVSMPGGPVEVGKANEFPTFGWDNEYGERTVQVAPFRAQKFMVTNGEFLEFVKSGGYLDESVWTEEGWRWRSFCNSKWPTFWRKDGPAGLHQYKLRVLFDEIPMQWDWPVEVNHLEAQAYCRWKAKQDKVSRYHLTTEPIHHILRDGPEEAKTIAKSDEVMEVDGRMSDSHAKNLNLSYASCSPVNAFPPNKQGFHDVMGNAWELAEDNFCALPGFQVHPIYDDFSLPCFDGQHNMIMGGSFISCGDNGASAFSRYHFRKHFFQHSGFRLVQSEGDDPVTTCLDAPGPYAKPNPYRSSSSNKTKCTKLAVGSHFGQDDFDSMFNHVNTPARLAEFTTQAFKKHATPATGPARVVDIGCGAGAISFKLSSAFEHVVGIDNDVSTIEVAETLCRSGEIESVVLKEPVDSSRIEFHTVDATAQQLPIKDADSVVVFNVLEHMEDPSEFLANLHPLVRPGGILVLGTNCRSRTDLQQVFENNFEYLEEEDIPTYWRDQDRSCRITMMTTSVWRRQSN